MKMTSPVFKQTLTEVRKGIFLENDHKLGLAGIGSETVADKPVVDMMESQHEQSGDQKSFRHQISGYPHLQKLILECSHRLYSARSLGKSLATSIGLSTASLLPCLGPTHP